MPIINCRFENKYNINSEGIKVESNFIRSNKLNKLKSKVISHHYQSRPMTTKNVEGKRKLFIHSKRQNKRHPSSPYK